MANSWVDPMQLASLGAAVIVTEMVKSGWMSMQERLARIFRRGGNASRHLEMIGADQQELVKAPETEKEAVKARLLSRWQLQLAAFLDQYPEAGEDLLELIESSAEGTGERGGGHSVTALGNTGSQVVQAAGDVNTGGGGISFTPPTH